MKQAIAIQHALIEGLGSLEPVLVQQGYQISYLNAAETDLSQIDPLGPDLVVILGGTMGVYEVPQYPFLKDELQFLQTRLQADRPTLGICLGAQLMAGALGAKVYPGPAGPEIGWGAIALTPEGQQSPLTHLTTSGTRVLQWHGDTFDLPAGATRLAGSSYYVNQAFSWGQHGLAVQFHPEVTIGALTLWFEQYGKGVPQVTQMQAETPTYGPVLEQQATRFWQAWLEAR